MTYIYLLRHGIAQERELSKNDYDRELTSLGREKTTAVAKRLNKLGLQCNLILTSPLVRAQQTAQILSDVFGSTPIEVKDWLKPEGSFAEWSAWLQEHQSIDSVFLVGHEPDLSLWTEIMVWGQGSGNILLKKAGVIGLVSYSDKPLQGNCTLFLLVPPKILTEL